MKNDFEKTIKLICDNINGFGLVRYDPRDIGDIISPIKDARIRNVAGKGLQVIEAVTPILLRKFCGCKPRLYPTTYTFLAESLYDSYDKIPLRKTATSLMDECIKEYYEGEGYWKYLPNISMWSDLNNTDKPSMPLYMLTRCNNLLTRLSLRDGYDAYMQISKDSLNYMFEHHTVFVHEDGTENVSYCYNSIDNTINVNTEVLDWISQIPNILNDNTIYNHFLAILRGVLNEQNDDGSWFYNSKAHMKKYGLYGERVGGIDCHHSATVIYNLIHVYHNLSDNLIDRRELKHRLKKAMQYFTSQFFKPDGTGITIIGFKRKASSVQYSEAVIAIIDYLLYVEYNEEYAKLLNNIMRVLASLVKSDGSAPGDSKIRPININNINWGNGPVLYALSHYVYRYGEK